MKNFNSNAQQFFEYESFSSLTEVQKQVNAARNSTSDLVVLSQTGTGKTHAYLFYLLNHLDLSKNQVQAVIIAPTRELAMQIHQVASRIKEIVDVRIELIIGGTDRNRLLKKLDRQPQIIIGTPGRINDLFTNESALRCDQADYLILDEADTIFEYGFIEDVDQVASKLKDSAQMLLFSATLPSQLKPFIKKYLKQPHLVEVDEDPIFKPQIDHVLINIKHQDYATAILDLISIIQPLMCLIFTNTRQEAVDLAATLRSYNLDCIELHGDLTARARKNALLRIQRGESQFIVATDIAARGIDLPEISHVINCGFPKFEHLSFYVHRAGRTGRTGQTGVCYTLVHQDDKRAALSLIRNNHIEFQYTQIKNKQLVEVKSFFEEQKRSKRTDPEIVKIVNTKKNRKVKPGYKKKMNSQIQKLEQKKKREIIQTSIKEQKKERAKRKQIEKNNEN